MSWASYEVSQITPPKHIRVQNALKKMAPVSGAAVLIQLAGATVTTAVAIRLAARAADDEYAALVVTAYSAGFALGCFLAPSTILRVGYIRAFAAAAALCTIAVILLDIFESAFSWALLRFAIGANFAFMLAAADGWVNARADDKTRGRVLALHSLFVGLGLVGSQILLLTVDSGQPGFFTLMALLVNVSVVVVCLMPGDAPLAKVKSGVTAEPLTFGLAFTSYVALAGAFLSGVMSTLMIGLTPFYLSEEGVPENIVALGVAALFAGRLLFQIPVGIASDRIGRRRTLIILAAVVFALSSASYFLVPNEGSNIAGDYGVGWQVASFGALILIGGAALPIYSVSATVAFDRAADHPLVRVGSTMLLVWSMGSVAGPMAIAILTPFFERELLAFVMMIASFALLSVVLVRKFVTSEPAGAVPAMIHVLTSSVAMTETAEKVARGHHERSDEEKLNTSG